MDQGVYRYESEAVGEAEAFLTVYPGESRGAD